MAKINGRADAEIRIYRKTQGKGFIIAASNGEYTCMTDVDKVTQLDSQGLWLLIGALRAEMEDWLF